MTLEYRRSLTELNLILSYMNVEYLKKIPTKFVDFINKNMDNEYSPNINKNVPINQQNLRKDTKVLLSLIYRNYWCENEVKEDLICQDLVEKQRYEQEMHEKYNPDYIFKNKIQKEEKVESHTELIEYKELSWYQIIVKNIKKWFARLLRKDCE